MVNGYRLWVLIKADKAFLQGAIKAHEKPQLWVYSDNYRGVYDNLDLEVLRAHEKTLDLRKSILTVSKTFEVLQQGEY